MTPQSGAHPCPVCDVLFGGATELGMIDAFVLGAGVGRMCERQDITAASLCCDKHRRDVVAAQIRTAFDAHACGENEG